MRGWVCEGRGGVVPGRSDLIKKETAMATKFPKTLYVVHEEGTEFKGNSFLRELAVEASTKNPPGSRFIDL